MLLDLVVPPLCLACGAPARDLCPSCRASLVRLPAFACRRCALPDCRRCPARGAQWDAAWSPLSHVGAARALVHALKFRRARAAADVLAAHLVGAPGWVVGARAVVVPVPGGPGRVRRRGYDQADVLAAALARRTGVPVASCLVRPAAGASRQLGAGRELRLTPGRQRVRTVTAVPRDCVLLDDVHTTGATLRACASALRAAGAERVTVVAATRALHR